MRCGFRRPTRLPPPRRRSPHPRIPPPLSLPDHWRDIADGPDALERLLEYEAVRLFVFTSRTAFVVAADEAMIEYAVRKHFPDLPDTTGPQTYARNYLEKLIQVPFRIPALGDTEKKASRFALSSLRSSVATDSSLAESSASRTC